MVFLFLLPLLIVLQPCLAQESDYRPAPYVEVEQLNAGLADFDEVAKKNLSTPEKTLGYFVRQSKKHNFRAAAYALNLQDTDPKKAPRLAKKLYELMDRQVGFPFESLPDRTDGEEPTTPTGSANLGGEPKKSFLLGTLSLDIGQFEIHLSRYRTPDLEGVWLFAPPTVAEIERAYDVLGPRDWERRLPDVLRYQTVDKTPLWAWLVLLAIIAVSAAITKWVLHLMKKVVKFDLVQKLQNGLVVLLTCWIPYFTMEFWVPLPGLARNTLLFIGFCVMVWLVSTTLNFYSERLIRSQIDSVEDLDELDHTEQKKTLTYLSVGRRVLSFVLFAVGLGVVALKIPHFESVGFGLLASAGALSILLGVAAQPILGNIISGIQIAISRPIRIGDSLTYDGTWCYVEDITYMYVLCRTWDEMRLVIPLRYFTSNPFLSDSLRDPRAMRTVEMKLDYTVEVEPLRQEYIKIVESSELWDRDHDPKLEVTSFNDETVTVRAVSWSKNASSAWILNCELREKLLLFLQSRDTSPLPRRRISGTIETSTQALSSESHSES